MKNKILSQILVLSMMIGLCPIDASAADLLTENLSMSSVLRPKPALEARPSEISPPRYDAAGKRLTGLAKDALAITGDTFDLSLARYAKTVNMKRFNETMTAWAESTKDKCIMDTVAKYIAASHDGRQIVLFEHPQDPAFCFAAPQLIGVSRSLMSSPQAFFVLIARSVVAQARLEDDRGFLAQNERRLNKICERMQGGRAVTTLIENVKAFSLGTVMWGGKGVWCKRLEELCKRTGFNMIPTSYIPIQDIWARFIEGNLDLVAQGNRLIEDDMRRHGKLQPETIRRLKKIKACFKSTEELGMKKDIDAYVDQAYKKSGRAGILKKIGRIISRVIQKADGEGKPQEEPWFILRSSGTWEDAFARNLAGGYTSKRIENRAMASAAMDEIYAQAIDVIWFGQNSDDRVEGIPNTLSAAEGLTCVAQPFMRFEASGTAMSSPSHTCIETVFGDADAAVKSDHPVTGQFLFYKGSDSPEYNTAFEDIPYSFKLDGRRYTVEADRREMERIIAQRYRNNKVNGRLSPITEKQAREINRIVKALSQDMGCPVDVEWGIVDGKIYITQVRPVIGMFAIPPSMDEDSHVFKPENFITETPIASGYTSSAGFKGKMVLFSDDVSDEDIARFEREHGKGYIRLQRNVAGRVRERPTRAKVLVDVTQGSRNAHNRILINDRIMDGELMYACGLVLREDLLQKAEFAPHPGIKGVLVSKDDITYFSNDSKGSFYFSGTHQPRSRVPPQGEDRESRIAAFRIQLEGMLPRTEPFAFDYLLTDFINKSVVPLFEPSIREEMRKILLERMPRDGNPDINAVLEWMNDPSLPEGFIDKIQPGIEFIEDAIAHPLYPSTWESRWIKFLNNIVFIKEAAIKMKGYRAGEKAMQEAVYNNRDEKLKVFIADDDLDLARLMRVRLKNMGPDYVVEHHIDLFPPPGTRPGIAADTLDFLPVVRVRNHTDPIDVFVVDLGMLERNQRLQREIVEAGIPHLVVISGLDNLKKDEIEHRCKTIMAHNYSGAGKPVIITPIAKSGELIPSIRHELNHICADKIKVLRAASPVRKKSMGRTLFIINRRPDDAQALEGLIRENVGGFPHIVCIDSIERLEVELLYSAPDMVVTDSELKGADELDRIIGMIAGKNSSAQIVVTSDKAAVLSRERLQRHNVRGIFPSAFNANGVMHILRRLISIQEACAKLESAPARSAAGSGV